MKKKAKTHRTINNKDDGLDDLSDDKDADVHNSIEDIDKEKNDNEVY